MSRKIDLVINTIRCITNIANTRYMLANDVQMFIDSGYTTAGSDTLTNEELAADENTAYLTYDKFVKAKDFKDAFETFLAANNREMEKILNELRTVIGK